MRGDGHTAYGGNSPCIDAAVDAYLEALTVPAAGTSCKQEVPFGEAQVQARSKAAARPALAYRGPGVKPLARSAVLPQPAAARPGRGGPPLA